MKKLILGIFFMAHNLTSYSATATYIYTGPKYAVMIGSEMLIIDDKDCTLSCSGQIEISFPAEAYIDYEIPYNRPIDIFILLESYEGSSLEFVITTTRGKHYAYSEDKDKNILKVNTTFGDYVKLKEIPENYLEQ